VIESPASLPGAITGGPRTIINAVVTDGDESCRLDGLERVSPQTPRSGAHYSPVLCVRREAPLGE